jgi:hypothetical protein
VRSVLTIVAAGAMMVALVACGEQPDTGADAMGQATPTPSPTPSPSPSPIPSPPSTTATRPEWKSWEPTFRDVRPATGSDRADFTARVTGTAAGEWTMVDSLTGIEIAYTPTHVRLRQRLQLSDEAVEVHVDPRRQGGDMVPPMVFCFVAACTYYEGRSDPGIEYFDDTDFDEINIGVPLVLTGLRLFDGFPEDRPASYAVVDSPAGPLDCIVVGDDERDIDHLNLTGKPVIISFQEAYDNGEPYTSICLGANDAMVITGSVFNPVLAVSDWRPGADDDIAAYPTEVRGLAEATDPGSLRD